MEAITVPILLLLTFGERAGRRNQRKEIECSGAESASLCPVSLVLHLFTNTKHHNSPTEPTAMFFNELRSLWLLSIFLLASVWANWLSADTPTLPPNIIFVLVDDMGWSDLSCFGGIRAQTPNIDRLAERGLRFRNFYVNAPICSPSRVAFTTGQYPHRWQITSYLDNRQQNVNRQMAQWLDPTAPVLARELKAAGYRTGHFGKWHMGGQRDVAEAPTIDQYGFDVSLTNFEGMGPKLLPLTQQPNWKEPRKIWEKAEILGGPVTWLERSKITSGYVQAAIQFIDKAQTAHQPFYINVWPDDVHSPFFPSLERWSDDKPKRYDAVLEQMDAQLQPLFERIFTDDALNSNTIIILCSDNGHEHGAGNSKPLRGSKTWLYEGGVRSPLIIYAPNRIPKDKEGTWNDTSVFCALDVNRSLYSLANIKPPAKLDGEDLSETIMGQKQTSRESPIFWQRPPDRPGFGHGLNEPNPDLAVRDQQWKGYMSFAGENVQLYDLSRDPSETKDLAADYPDVVKRLRDLTLEWHQSVQTPP